MSVSNYLIEFIKLEEGFREKAYIPLAGDRYTVGFGFTFLDGRPVNPNDTITEEDASEYLKSLLDKVNKQITYPGCNRPQRETDAVTSLVYNIGYDNYISSTTGRLFTQGKNIKDRFILWNRFRGEPNKGLTLRRLKETTIYSLGDYTSYPTTQDNKILKEMGFKV